MKISILLIGVRYTFRANSSPINVIKFHNTLKLIIIFILECLKVRRLVTLPYNIFSNGVNFFIKRTQPVSISGKSFYTLIITSKL